MPQRFTGKSVLITGAANGIGAVTALAFAKEGAGVVLADIDARALEKTAASIGKTIGDADGVLTVRCDVTNLNDMQAAVDGATKRFGGLDVAILNAGIENEVKTAEDLSVEEFERTMRVNVTGPFIGIKCCTPAMRLRGGGSILMTSSTSGKIGAAGLTPYTASKHALIGLMRAAALEGAPHNIRVNTVNPCPVETRMMRALEKGFSPDDSEAMHQALIAAIPLKRYAEPEDVAYMFLFLASDEARFLTGSVYMVDGGMTAGLTRA